MKHEIFMASEQELMFLLRIPIEERDIEWASSLCRVSRITHLDIWANLYSRSYVVSKILPLFSKAAKELEATVMAGMLDEELKRVILGIRDNLTLRLDNIKRNYLEGKQTAFLPHDRILKREEIGKTEIQYNCSDMEWHAPSAPDFREIRINSLTVKTRINVVIMTATEIELLQVLRVMKPLPGRRKLLKIPDGYETYYVGRFGRFAVAAIKCTMGSEGPSNASHTARSALERWAPVALILVGIAFGRDRNKHKPADVLIAEQIIPYEKQRVGKKAIFRAPIPLTGLTLFNRFENMLGWTFPLPDDSLASRHYGRILSGEKLIDDPDYKKELMAEFPEAIGGEMEALGVYAAALRGRIEWMVVKGVSDWADGKKHSGYQEMAAAAAVSLVYHVLSSKYALDGLH